jgi:hypothetical protein
MNVTLLQYLRMKIHFFFQKKKERKEKDNYEPSKKRRDGPKLERKGRKWPTRSFLGP